MKRSCSKLQTHKSERLLCIFKLPAVLICSSRPVLVGVHSGSSGESKTVCKSTVEMSQAEEGGTCSISSICPSSMPETQFHTIQSTKWGEPFSICDSSAKASNCMFCSLASWSSATSASRSSVISTTRCTGGSPAGEAAAAEA